MLNPIEAVNVVTADTIHGARSEIKLLKYRLDNCDMDTQLSVRAHSFVQVSNQSRSTKIGSPLYSVMTTYLT